MIASILAGSVAWSGMHYLGHRVWHIHMHRGKSGGLLVKEVLHHVHYDLPAHPDESHIGFPWEMWAKGVGIVVGGYALGAALLPFAGGVFGSLIIDDYFHKAHHRGTLKWAWFNKWHAAHHRTHDSNYGMVTGALWDFLGGTRG